ncbi:MAG: hypothetical protein WDN45_13965 [Caulobacteraceae bacterium]
MTTIRSQIVRQLETLADTALFASIPFITAFMALALIPRGLKRVASIHRQPSWPPDPIRKPG